MTPAELSSAIEQTRQSWSAEGIDTDVLHERDSQLVEHESHLTLDPDDEHHGVYLIRHPADCACELPATAKRATPKARANPRLRNPVSTG